jgi:tripartite-type tricarboxylate transporter receptor subunit TctC
VAKADARSYRVLRNPMLSVRFALAAAALVAATIGPQAVWAQSWPSRPVTMVVPFPAGGATDILARALGRELTEKLGQQFVIDNRTGATGNIGAATAAKAARDGYTILFSTPGPIALNQLMSKGLSFDPQKDFAPIVVIAQSPHIHRKAVAFSEGPERVASLWQGQSWQDHHWHSRQRHDRPHLA